MNATSCLLWHIGLFADGFVDEGLDVAAGADAAKVGIVARGAHPIAQEDVEHVVLGIYPEAGARESGVAIGLGGGLGTGVAGVRISHNGFVEAQAAMTIGALLRREGLDGRGFQQAHAAVGAAVEPHLEEFGQVVGVAEQAGIALHTAREGCQLVVDVAVDVLAAQVGVLFGIGDFVARELAQGAVHRVVGTQGSKDVIVHIIVERRVRHALHGVGQ